MINNLSIILPVYNEEIRLQENLKKIKKFFSYKKIKKKEFIFVDDGSTDNTANIIRTFISNNSKKKLIRLISLKKNSGKGAALKRGVLSAKYDWILTSDIDFSVSLYELDKWMNKKYINFKKNNEAYFGSRACAGSVVKSKFYRKFIGYVLGKLILNILKIEVMDTQCGFKLYKKKIAKLIFFKVASKGFEHDLEIVLLLKKFKIKIFELPVTWVHKKYSKVNLIHDSLNVLKNIFILKKKFRI